MGVLGRPADLERHQICAHSLTSYVREVPAGLELLVQYAKPKKYIAEVP
jgi:hypothetical protein